MNLSWTVVILINCFGTEGNNRLVYCGRFDWKSFIDVIARYCVLLNVFDFNYDTEIFNLTSGGKILFFISKIIISIGIYQTITAFRKFSK